MAEQKPKPGSVVHVELVSKEPEKTKKFYHDVFGWKYQEMPEMNYAMIESLEAPGGGIRAPSGSESPGTLSYLLVANIDEALRKSERAGAKVILEKQEVPGMGWTGIVLVPGGVVQGLWQANPQAQQR